MMIEARRRTWPELSPCNSTNDKVDESQILCNSSIRTITNSSLLSKKRDSTGSCPAWSLTSFMENCPDSPSPKCSSFSPHTVISCSPTSDDIFYSQMSTQFSTPRNKSQSTMSDDDKKISSSSDEIQEEVNGVHDNFVQSDGEIIMEEEYTAVEQAYQPLVGMTLLVVSEEEQTTEDRGQSGSNDSSSTGHHRLITRPKPYHAFLDEIKKKELEEETNAWKEAKHQKLMTKLRQREDAINAWELEQTKKATIRMKKIEGEFEKKRAKALKTLEEKIKSIRMKADMKKAKERQSTVGKISMVSRVADRIRDKGNRIWLKFLCCL